MLVLRRKKDEKIVIDGNIVITVLEVRKNTVRLGIEAPEEILILRSELIVPLPPDDSGATNSDAVG